jgi:hypothetical protein
MVDSAIAEAKILQERATAQGVEVSASVVELIKTAEQKNAERQTETAFVLADEAILQLQTVLLKQEQAALDTERKAAAASLEDSRVTLNNARSTLNERRNSPRERVIN